MSELLTYDQIYGLVLISGATTSYKKLIGNALDALYDKIDALEAELAEQYEADHYDAAGRFFHSFALQHGYVEGESLPDWLRGLIAKIDALEAALEEKPPDADATLLASGNRMLVERCEEYEGQIAELKRIAVDLAWMARRYCDGRQTYAPSIYNEHARALLEMGVQLNATGDGLIWAKDGDGIDGLSEECHTPGHPEAVGHVIPLPPGTHLVRELEDMLGKDTTAAVVRIRALMEFAKNMVTIDAMGNVELEFAYKRIGEMASAVLARATEGER